MVSERLQRRIDGALDEADEAKGARDWAAAGREFLFADRGLSNLKGFVDPVRTWELL